MSDDRVQIGGGPESEIMADARALQGRHAPGLLKAAARRLRGIVDGGAGERATADRTSFAARPFTAD